jgi:hypothetical protein
VLIEGVSIINSPMGEVNPVLCTHVIVRGVRNYQMKDGHEGVTIG